MICLVITFCVKTRGQLFGLVFQMLLSEEIYKAFVGQKSCDYFSIYSL